MFLRAFTEGYEEEGIPYYDLSAKMNNNKERNRFFYAQRITSLVPYGDSLYATTSNLNGWGDGPDPVFLSDEQISEYGNVFRIRKSGCASSYQSNAN